MNEDTNSPLFDIFWENSKFSEVNIGEFQKLIEEYSGAEHEMPALQYPKPDHKLPMPTDRQVKQMQRRKSDRLFAEKKINKKQLGSLLAAFSKNNSDGRTYPSAGATYGVDIFCLVNNYDGELNHKVCYYNADNHSLSEVKALPDWESYAPLLNIDTDNSMPAVVFVFVLFASRVTSKYGERGGRFALIEVGHAAQNLSLRLVEEKMVGVEMGGLLDNEIKALLGLEDTSAAIALGLACGFAK
ncbi:SagB/ThcOx family dehydrogenase [Candidatus Saccharibacteria bacterium]|nr:MAG: SagB/ThcOx family dehydrogenase [Candidatus Saccharibacteria bacterium]